MSALIVPPLPTPPPAPPEVVHLNRRSFILPSALVFADKPKLPLWRRIKNFFL